MTAAALGRPRCRSWWPLVMVSGVAAERAMLWWPPVLAGQLRSVCSWPYRCGRATGRSVNQFLGIGRSGKNTPSVRPINNLLGVGRVRGLVTRGGGTASTLITRKEGR